MLDVSFDYNEGYRFPASTNYLLHFSEFTRFSPRCAVVWCEDPQNNPDTAAEMIQASLVHLVPSVTDEACLRCQHSSWLKEQHMIFLDVMLAAQIIYTFCLQATVNIIKKNTC